MTGMELINNRPYCFIPLPRAGKWRVHLVIEGEESLYPQEMIFLLKEMAWEWCNDINSEIGYDWKKVIRSSMLKDKALNHNGKWEWDEE